MAGENPTETEFRGKVADAHNDLGVLFLLMIRPAEAEGKFRAALGLSRELAGAEPTITDHRRLSRGEDICGQVGGRSGDLSLGLAEQ